MSFITARSLVLTKVVFRSLCNLVLVKKSYLSIGVSDSCWFRQQYSTSSKVRISIDKSTQLLSSPQQYNTSDKFLFQGAKLHPVREIQGAKLYLVIFGAQVYQYGILLVQIIFSQAYRHGVLSVLSSTVPAASVLPQAYQHEVLLIGSCSTGILARSLIGS